MVKLVYSPTSTGRRVVDAYTILVVCQYDLVDLARGCARHSKGLILRRRDPNDTGFFYLGF